MATAWAVMHKLGIDGYRRLTAKVIDAARRITAGVRDTPGICVLGEPEAHLLAIAGDGADVFAIGDAMHTRGWYLDRQQPPDSLHMTVSAGNAPVVDDFLRDLRTSADEVGTVTTADRSTNYATLE
jgi:glutamate/tyrosine decarboxylase-like PLP-dependent enzyme